MLKRTNPMFEGARRHLVAVKGLRVYNVHLETGCRMSYYRVKQSLAVADAEMVS